MRLFLFVTSIPILMLLGIGSAWTHINALNNNEPEDFVTVETSGKSYKFSLDYTVLPENNQIIKNQIAEDDIVNANRRTPIRGVFNSPDQRSIVDFDAFLIRGHRIIVNYENGTIKFNNRHHLINLECNFNSTNQGCSTFYGEFPYRKEPTEYMIVLVAYFDNYVKYYITKVNLN